MQATGSKIFTTGLVAAMAMLALVASLFAVQPAFADDLAAGTMLGEQSQQPQIKVKDSDKVTVAKTISIKAENLTAKQTGTWVWEAAKGSSLVQLSNTDSDTVKVKGVKGGQATLKVSFITDSGKKASKTVKVNVYGIKSSITKGGIVYKRSGVDSVRVIKTKGNKDLGKAAITIGSTIKLGDDSAYQAKYKVVSLKTYSLNNQKKTTKISIGNNVKTIGSSSFTNNPKMKSLTLGTAVQKICKSIVNGKDKSLKTITIKSTKLTKANVKNCFKGAKYLKTVKVPASKVNAYKKIFTKANCGAKVKVVAL